MAENEIALEVDDAIVLLLGGPAQVASLKDRIDGVTRLEKLVFLIERETSLGALLTESPEFGSHNFGPFSAKVYQAVDTLQAAGLVEDSASLAPSTEDSWESEKLIGTTTADPYATRNITLTKRGRRYYEALLEELPANIEPVLSDFKDRFGSLPLRQLVRYVYKRYPDFTDRSLIRDQILDT